MLDRVREVSEDKLGAILDSGVDDSLKHLDDKVVKVALIVFAGADLLVNLATNLCVSLSLLLNESEDVELDEALGLLEGADDFGTVVEGIHGTTRSDKEHSWLDEAAQLLERLVKVLLSVDAAEVSALLKVRHELLSVLVVLTNTLR